MLKPKPKILFFDIETLPNVGLFFGLGKQHIAYNQILKEKKICAISYKWQGKKVVNLKMDMSKHDVTKYDDQADKAMLLKFMDIYAQADLAIGHNAMHFDKGTILARIIKYGLTDVFTPIIIDDTYLKSKHIRFNCHKLDYLTNYFELGGKLPTDFSLWKNVHLGSKKHLDYMSKYCGNDVVILEKVYNKLAPYIASNLNRGLLSAGLVCVNCGSPSIQSNGFKVTKAGKYRRYLCNICGSTRTNSKKNEGKADVK